MYVIDQCVDELHFEDRAVDAVFEQTTTRGLLPTFGCLSSHIEAAHHLDFSGDWKCITSRPMTIILDNCCWVLCPRHNVERVGMYNNITEVIMRRLLPRKTEKRARNRFPGPFLDYHNSAHSELCDFSKVVVLCFQWNDLIKSHEECTWCRCSTQKRRMYNIMNRR